MIRIEISIKRNGYVCTVYDDKKHVELGICDYSVAREVLGESLKDNIRQQFGLSQATLHKLNLASSNVKSEASPETNYEHQSTKIQYINANRTPEEEMQLQRQLAQSNREIRGREHHSVKKSNGNQIRVNTHSLK